VRHAPVPLGPDAAERGHDHLAGVRPQADKALDGVELKRAHVALVALLAAFAHVEGVRLVDVVPHRGGRLDEFLVLLGERRQPRRIRPPLPHLHGLVVDDGPVRGVILTPGLSERDDVVREPLTADLGVGLEVLVEEPVRVRPLHLGHGVQFDGGPAVEDEPRLLMRLDQRAGEVAQSDLAMLPQERREILAMNGAHAAGAQYLEQRFDQEAVVLDEHVVGGVVPDVSLGV
jgi:hypothetical protein